MTDTANVSPGRANVADSGLRLSRVALDRDSKLSVFVSNLKEFLTEKPAKIHGGPTPYFSSTSFGAGVRENLTSFFQPTPRLAAGAPGSDLLVNWSGEGFGSFWRNIHDLIWPPKLPPLQVTSKPVKVKDIWSKDTQFTRVQALSLAIHVLIIALIVVPLLPRIFGPAVTKPTVEVTPIDISPYVPKLPAGPHKAGGGGGGGAHEVVPASVGRAPKFALTRFTPPEVKPPQHPQLAMTPTVVGPPNLQLPNPNLDNWGDPLAKLQTESNGPGDGGGIGSGKGGSLGSGNGLGVGPGEGWGAGGGSPHAGENGFGTPACLYCPQPEFSNEAVKAKYQGTVLVQALITTDGRATNIRIVKGVGLGLDEKAVDAVRTWRFKPATGPDGRPSSVITLIEVTFHLY